MEIQVRKRGRYKLPAKTSTNSSSGKSKMSFHLSTKEVLLGIIDDMEIISKELIENTIVPKHQHPKITSPDQSLVELLVAKDNELKAVLKQADEQAKTEQDMDDLRAKVEVQDNEINLLQKHLKDAEQILSTALFQARQKLASINRANKRPVASEELIKFAHRISATHSICAPLQWQQGDLGRPYPTDTEIRRGHLGKADLSLNGHNLQHQNSLNDLHRNTTGGAVPASTQNQFAWHSSGELHMAMGGGSVSLETRAHKEASQEDVEVMSTESSSSSSSDSQ